MALLKTRPVGLLFSARTPREPPVLTKRPGTATAPAADDAADASVAGGDGGAAGRPRRKGAAVGRQVGHPLRPARAAE